MAEGIEEDLIEATLVEDLEKGILKGQIEILSRELCMKQLAINAAINARFLSSPPVASLFTAAIALERMNILNQGLNQVHLQES